MLRQKLHDSMIPTYNYTFVMEGLQTIICFFFFVTDNVNIPLKYEKKRNKNVLQMEYLVNFPHILK